MALINLLLIIISLLSPSIEAQQLNYWMLDIKCLNTTTFSTTYKSNRDSVLSSLLSNATSGEGFYNTTSGMTPADMVYGLYLCRGDASTDLCKECVTNATTTIPQRCSVETTAVIWYDMCVVRYSDQNIFSVLVQEPPFVMFNDNNVTEQDLFSRQVKSMMKNAANRAAYGSPGGLKFATREAKFSRSQTLYTLVQCTPDLSSQDCDTCLQASIAIISDIRKEGATLLKPSCNVRYEIYAFYFQTVVASLPPDPLTPGLTPGLAPGLAPGLTPEEKQNKSKKIQLLVASLSATFVLVVVCSFCFLIRRRRNSQVKQNSQEIQLLDLLNEQSRRTFNGDNGGKTQEFPSIKLDILLAATDQFSHVNKLGAGGFGPVYKGTLADGKDIAVKRLSRTSGQGLIEFKNEIMLIAKLQHRNLVRLLGCCLEQNEKLLVYEFMPNRSLDVFLFDSNIAAQLDWHKRFIIIKGIARGILYLHEDSRLKIIHRDLKASNVLLDDKMNPKISDFGLARIFEEDENEADTKRVVGTYGYMAPEYAMEGLFSVKSDVFSFGVIVLEIISGKKNNGFYLLESGESLLTYAWKLWSKGEGMELIDQLLVQSCEASEVLKCIHIGLLCVQDDPSDRPSMSSVIVMLASDGTITFSRPTEPSFFVGRVVAKPAKPISNKEVISVDKVTISYLSAR